MPKLSLSPSDVNILRDQARAIFMSGVEAADPRKAVERVLRVQERHLEIILNPGSEESAIRSEPWRRVHLVAFGKAACAMAAKVETGTTAKSSP